MTPSALGPGTGIEVSGSVNNGDDHTWRAVQAYLVISPNPLTSRSELAAAASSPPESYIGERILAPGSFSQLGRLPVGASSAFTLEVPWRTLSPEISGTEGVYTVGVQLLATDVDGTRDTEQALARTRTFVPLVESGPGDRPALVDLGLVWPLRHPVLRRSDGSYAGAYRLRTSLDLGGRLRRVVELAGTADGTPLSLAPDPALLDAAQDLADARFGPPGPARAGQDTGAGGQAASAAAGGWLQDVVALFGTSGWLTAYAEPDPQAVADATRLRAAVTRAGRATAESLLGGVAPTLVLPDPRSTGAESLGALQGRDGDQVAVLSSELLPDWDATQGVAVAVPVPDAGSLRVLVADPALAAGGPEPGDPDSALQMRQRLLAETALISLSGTDPADGSTHADRQALFVAPPEWDPGEAWPTSDFFSGLNTAWLRPTSLDTLLSTVTPYTGTVSAPATPAEAAADPVVTERIAASTTLARRSATLSRLLGGDRPLADWYAAAAALGVSSYGRDDGRRRLALTRRTSGDLVRQLDRVSLDGPSFVTLSSSRGRFGVTITNGLEQPVTVGVRVAAAAEGLVFDTGGPVTVGPGERQTVIVDARVGDNRVTSARAYLVTAGGERFGKRLAFNVRTSVVGVVIWVVVGVAALLLLIAIVRRLWQRVSRRSDRPGAAARG